LGLRVSQHIKTVAKVKVVHGLGLVIHQIYEKDSRLTAKTLRKQSSQRNLLRLCEYFAALREALLPGFIPNPEVCPSTSSG